MTSEQRMNVNLCKCGYVSNKAEAEKAEELLTRLRKPLDEQIAQLTREFERENNSLIVQIREAKDAATAYENDLRSFALEHFKQSGEKVLDENLSVRVNAKLEYEMTDAVKWAESNAPIFIQKSVDKKAFEKIADGLEFVHKIETPRAVIKGL